MQRQYPYAFQNKTTGGNVGCGFGVALDKNAVHYNIPVSFSYIDDTNSEEYYFDEIIAAKLENDGFLTEMWSKLDAVFDWGDCDFFLPEKCAKFHDWLIERLSKDTNNDIRLVYEKMLDYSEKAIKYKTGISFDF